MSKVDEIEADWIAGLNRYQLSRKYKMTWPHLTRILTEAGYDMTDLDGERRALYGFDTARDWRGLGQTTLIGPQGRMLPHGLFIPAATLDQIAGELQELIKRVEGDE